MSLFESVDWLENRIAYLDKKKTLLSRVSDIFLLESKKRTRSESIREEKEFILNLKNRFLLRIKKDNYENINNEIDFVAHALTQFNNKKHHDYIHEIHQDLLKIQESFERWGTQTQFDTEMNTDKALLNADENLRYKKYQTKNYQIAPINQGLDYRLGTSTGYCYGYAFAMVDPELSPYISGRTSLSLNQKIHIYQNHVFHPLAEIKRTRLTGRYFCPDMRKQAEEILNVASEQQGEVIEITLRAQKVAHAVSMRVRMDHQVEYMDANHGAYLFKNKEDFIDFYMLSRRADFKYKFYEIVALKNDVSKKLKEPTSVRGKIRSVLYGTKYYDDHTMILGILFHVCFCLFLFLTQTPVVYVVLVVAKTLVELTLMELCSYATSQGYSGILGVVHLCQEYWYDYQTRGEEPTPYDVDYL